eukprot:358007-Chlamydomonas_euryale.AAC.7
MNAAATAAQKHCLLLPASQAASGAVAATAAQKHCLLLPASQAASGAAVGSGGAARGFWDGAQSALNTAPCTMHDAQAAPTVCVAWAAARAACAALAAQLPAWAAWAARGAPCAAAAPACWRHAWLGDPTPPPLVATSQR